MVELCAERNLVEQEESEPVKVRPIAASKISFFMIIKV